jgi:NIMA (never in mitosis gene a)-related kinase 2
LHRDLKPGNIFLDEHQNVKLGDFGLARILNPGSVFAQTHVGTPYYMSPEQIQEKKYNDKTDIWSLGCIVYELCALRPPFRANNHFNLANTINSGKFERIPKIYSDELWVVIQHMITVNPDYRCSIDELHNLPIIKERITAGN